MSDINDPPQEKLTLYSPSNEPSATFYKQEKIANSKKFVCEFLNKQLESMYIQL